MICGTVLIIAECDICGNGILRDRARYTVIASEKALVIYVMAQDNIPKGKKRNMNSYKVKNLFPISSSMSYFPYLLNSNTYCCCCFQI